MVFFNETGQIGMIIVTATTNITGSLFLTLLMMIIILLSISMLFRIPIEFTSIFILPLLLIFMAYSSEFLAIGGIFLIYMGIIFAKNFFIGR
jgi:hypothetical protein